MDNILHQRENGELWYTYQLNNGMRQNYRIKETLFSVESEIQHIMIVDSYAFGKMLLLDGHVEVTEKDNYIYNEMITFVPLLIHPNPKKVLIIGGACCGVAREAEKFAAVESIDVVEMDQQVIEACKTYFPGVEDILSDSRLHLIYADGYKHLQEHVNQYDVIIVDGCDPADPTSGLYQSNNFYESIYNALKSDGLFTLQTEIPYLWPDDTKRVIGKIGSLFPIVKPYVHPEPSLPSGGSSITLGSKKHHELKLTNLPTATKYVTKEILESSFVLPELYKNLLGLK